RTIEAELRFQIEEEVRAQIARENPHTLRRGNAIRLPSGRERAPRAQAVLPVILSAAKDLSGPPALLPNFADPGAPAPGTTDASLPSPDAAKAQPLDGLDIDDETREVFAVEAAEHLKRIDVDAAILAKDPSDVSARAALRRSVHTLKGAAAMMGFQAIAMLAHSIEDRLEDGAPPAVPAAGDLL